MAATSESFQATRGPVSRLDRDEARISRGSACLAGALGILARHVRGLLQGIRGRAGDAAPTIPGSPIHGLCRRYEAGELWKRYYAFRVDPNARTWRRLRRQIVPWLSGRRVIDIMKPLEPFNRGLPPDAASLERMLLAFPGAPRMADTSFDETVRGWAHPSARRGRLSRPGPRRR